MRTVLAMLLVATLVACGEDSPMEPPPPPTVTGAWSGEIVGLDFHFTLSEAAGGAVSGSGTMIGASSVALEVLSGTHAHPNISLHMDADGYESFNFSGTVGPRTMTGNLNGSGFANEALVLRKQ